MFDAAEFRFAHARENFRNRQSGGFRDALIEVDVRPADLAGQQPGDGGLAAAHESGQADERASANFSGHRV